MLSLAKGDYEVVKRPLFDVSIIHDDVELIPSSMYAIVKSNNLNVHLGYCTAKWKAVQNDVLFNYFQPSVDNGDLIVKHGATFEDTCFMLFQLKKNYGCSSLGLQPYLLVTNTHNGESSIKLNLLMMKTDSLATLANTVYSFSHYDVLAKGLDVESYFNNFINVNVNMYQRFGKLATKSCNLDSYVNYVFGHNKRALEYIKRNIELLELAKEVSVWDALLAIVDYLNFQIGSYSQATRIIHLWMRDNGKLLKRVVNYALCIENN